MAKAANPKILFSVGDVVCVYEECADQGAELVVTEVEHLFDDDGEYSCTRLRARCAHDANATASTYYADHDYAPFTHM
jgi:hypothetical protein